MNKNFIYTLIKKKSDELAFNTNQYAYSNFINERVFDNYFFIKSVFQLICDSFYFPREIINVTYNCIQITIFFIILNDIN